MKLFFENILLLFRVLTLWPIYQDFKLIHYIKITLILFLNVITSGAKILAPAALAKAVEMIAQHRNRYSIAGWSVDAGQLLYFSVLLAGWIKSDIYIKRLLARDFEKLQVNTAALRLIETAHAMPFEIHQQKKVDITKGMMDIINLQAKLTSEVSITIYQAIIDIMTGLIIIFQKFGRLIGLEFLGYLILDVFLLNLVVDYLTKREVRFQKYDRSLHGFINHEYEVLNYEETVRTFHHEQLEVRLSAKLLDKYLHHNSRQQMAEDLSAVIKIIPIIIASSIPIGFLIKESLSLSDLDDFIFLSSYISLFGASVGVFNQSIKNAFRSIRSILQLSQLHTDGFSDSLRLRTENSALLRPIFTHDPPLIEFRDVVFSYANTIEPVLRGVSFTLLPGRRIGLIGRSNAGKSTIIKLLFGLYQKQSGEIKLNGHPIESISKETLAKIFCCIPQTAELFRERSLKYNVVYGSEKEDLIYNYATAPTGDTNRSYQGSGTDPRVNDYERLDDEQERLDRDVYNAMDKVKLAPLLVEADAQTKVQGLSGGQRQRVSLARALMRNSSVFIFDESSSNLDAFSECQVLQNIKEVTVNKTTIMITHRLATIADVDDVLVLENGKLVEQGPPKHLLELKGSFYDYWRMQV